MRVPGHRAMLVAYFVFGGFAVFAQATLLREMQVLVLGSELAWGLALGGWLAGVATGAAVGGRLARGPRSAAAVFAAATGAAAPAWVGAVVLLRLGRALAGVGPGEYVGPGATALLALAGTVPVSLAVGLAFPAVSALLARRGEGTAERARAVGWVYLAESAGALAGGALFSFVLVARVRPVALALVAGAVLALAVERALAWAGTGRRWRGVVVLLAAVLAAGVALGGAEALERWSAERRWGTFAPGLDLVASVETRYQHLDLGRLQAQFSLYGGGLVGATWPDHAASAVVAHLAACQHPAPKRMLLLGGGEDGLLAELARHRPDRIDLVTLDRRRLALVRAHLDPVDRAALEALEAAGGLHFEDGRRFVRRAVARGRRYDLVVLAAPEPASILEARLYTREFFAMLARAMSEDGVVVFALSGPVGYWSEEPAAYVGSVLRPFLVGTLREVFPETLLTFSSPMWCFAARRRGVLTDRGEVLAARYRRRGVRSPWFDPLWFEGGSEWLDGEKRRGVRRALAELWARAERRGRPVLPNTDVRPAAALYHVRYWMAQSAAAHTGPEAPAEHRADWLGWLLGVRLRWALVAVGAATVLAAGAAALGGGRRLRRTAVLWSVGTTGLASMAVEIVLMHIFQTFYGYVYGMVGLVVGVFMLGLVVGSLAMNRRLRRVGRPGLGALAGLDLAVAVFALGVAAAGGLLGGWASEWGVQATTFLLVGAAGVLGGLVFPLGAALRLEGAGSPGASPEEVTGRAAGAVDAADHVGAFVGALVGGAVLVPALGLLGACAVVAAMKGAAAALVGLAARTGRGG